MSSFFDKLLPPYSRVAGSIRVVTRLLKSSVTKEAELVSSDPTDHFQLRPGPQEASHPQCASVCVCVCVCACVCISLCVSSGEGGLLSLNFPPWLEWMSSHSVAQLNLSIFLRLWVHSVEAKWQILTALDVTSSQAQCLFTRDANYWISTWQCLYFIH